LVELVAPSIWEQMQESVYAGLTSSLKNSAQAILTALQNRHIGITPALAAELAQLLEHQPGSRTSSGCWDAVIKRLLEESGAPRRAVAILPARVPLYILLRLAGPVIQAACQRLHACTLFCRDEISNSATAEAYQHYAQQLESEIHGLAANTDTKTDPLQTFWKEQALTLTSYSRRAPLWGCTAPRLAEIFPPALSLLLGVNPKLTGADSLAIHPRTRVTPLKNLEIQRMTEGGFSGIHISRRLEDMGDILLSEFLNPPAVLADRLINNGYLTLQRETKLEQLRDVLIVGLLPAGIEPAPSADFIKACWFDFIARFGFLLYRSRLLRSEFRWLEGDALGRVSSCQFLLKELPALDIPVAGDLTPVFRREFLAALGWLPQFLDTRRPFEKVPQYHATTPQLKVAGELDTASQRQWAYSAWRSQRENILWGMQDPVNAIGNTPRDHEKRLAIETYAYLHIMLFLPAAKRKAEKGETISAATRLGPLYSGLGIGQSQIAGSGHRYSASITWVPETITAAHQWAFDCKESHTTPLFPPPSSNPNINNPYTTYKIAASLEQAWRFRLLKELQDE